jgi:hypothetical protein
MTNRAARGAPGATPDPTLTRRSVACKVCAGGNPAKAITNVNRSKLGRSESCQNFELTIRFPCLEQSLARFQSARPGVHTDANRRAFRP